MGSRWGSRSSRGVTQGSRSRTHAGVTLLTFQRVQGFPPLGGTLTHAASRSAATEQGAQATLPYPAKPATSLLPTTLERTPQRIGARGEQRLGRGTRVHRGGDGP